MAHDGTGSGWTETDPQDTESVSDGALEIRDLRKGAGKRIGKEHLDPGASTVGGEHIKGSAVAYYGSSAPTLLPDGGADGYTPTALASAATSIAEGRLWIDTSDGRMLKVYVDPSAWQFVTMNNEGNLGIVGRQGSEASNIFVPVMANVNWTGNGASSRVIQVFGLSSMKIKYMEVMNRDIYCRHWFYFWDPTTPNGIGWSYSLSSSTLYEYDLWSEGGGTGIQKAFNSFPGHEMDLDGYAPLEQGLNLNVSGMDYYAIAWGVLAIAS